MPVKRHKGTSRAKAEGKDVPMTLVDHDQPSNVAVNNDLPGPSTSTAAVAPSTSDGAPASDATSSKSQIVDPAIGGQSTGGAFTLAAFTLRIPGGRSYKARPKENGNTHEDPIELSSDHDSDSDDGDEGSLYVVSD